MDLLAANAALRCPARKGSKGVSIPARIGAIRGGVGTPQAYSLRTFYEVIMKSVFLLLVHTFLLVVSLSGCAIVGLKGKLSTRTAGESQALESSVLKHTIAADAQAPSKAACNDPELPCPAPVPSIVMPKLVFQIW